VARASRTEEGLIERLAAVFARDGAPGGALLGIGDDAAVLAASDARLVWTVDTSVEGVHFERRWLSWLDVGARSFHAAVSDVAAMGARPRSALSSLILPADFPERALVELVRGQALASRELRCPVVGGNLSRGKPLSVTTTVLGSVDRPLTRAGARANDVLWLVGDVGLAAAGLALLRRRSPVKSLDRASRNAVAAALGAWRRPQARVREARRLAGRARAAIDVSDGLGRDAGHLAERSGVRIVIEEPRLRAALRPELLSVCELLRRDALSLALGGGEDYALLLTARPRVRLPGAQRIGHVEKGEGVVLVQPNGSRVNIAATGFDHFKARKRTLPR
jgi:thiamine-monophosphate kinase